MCLDHFVHTIFFALFFIFSSLKCDTRKCAYFNTRWRLNFLCVLTGKNKPHNSENKFIKYNPHTTIFHWNKKEISIKVYCTPTGISTKFGLNWLCEPGNKSYKPQYFFSISMRNGCLLTIVYKVIIRLTGNCFSYQYMLGATVCLYSQNAVELEN